MSKVGKLWTDSTAYLALIIGAGLSIAGNVADTFRTRGQATDALDIILAIAWPALVVLMVEIFVSARWVGLAWPMQILRWAGTLAIGGMAMLVSWIHLNDLMATRNQGPVVATCGPLAIDLLAIMATALILAGRRTVANMSTDALPSPILDTPRTMLADEVSDYLARLSNVLDSTTTPAVPVVPGDLPQRPRKSATGRGPSPRIDADEAITLGRIGMKGSEYNLGQISELLGGHYGVSGRTIRAQDWWPMISGRPVSTPPAGG